MPELSDEQRMHAAVELSSGRPDDDAEQIRRWGTQRAIVLRVIAVLGMVVVGLAVGMFLLSGSRADRGRSALSGWRDGLATASSVVGLLVVAAAVIWLFASGRFSSGWRSPLLALTWRQRQALRKQVTGRRELDPGQLPVARRCAHQMTQGWPQLMNMTGLQIIWLGNALRSDSQWQWALCGFLAATLVALVIQTGRDQAIGQRFLATHPAPTEELPGD